MTTETTLQNRTIEIECTPELNYPSTGGYGATATYRQTGANPPSMNGRVDGRGNINLTNLAKDSDFNDNVDIIITLNASKLKDRSGNATAGRWALPAEGPTWYPNGDHVGCCWFCEDDPSKSPPYDPTKPIRISGMGAALVPPVTDTSPVKIQDDVPDDGPAYGFCLGLVLPDVSNTPYFITLDPVLGTKTTRGNTFMLKE